jgi:hypothetical protein
MAHFAKLGKGNIVERVEVVSNDIATTEQAGVDFINKLYNTRDAFIAPKPFNSWVLNEDTCRWDAPVVKPTDGQNYKWNETIKNWELI